MSCIPISAGTDGSIWFYVQCHARSRSLTVTTQATASGRSTGGRSSGCQLFGKKTFPFLCFALVWFPFLSFPYFCPTFQVRTSRAKLNLDQSVHQPLWGGSHMLTYADGKGEGLANYTCVCVSVHVQINTNGLSDIASQGPKVSEYLADILLWYSISLNLFFFQLFFILFFLMWFTWKQSFFFVHQFWKAYEKPVRLSADTNRIIIPFPHNTDTNRDNKTLSTHICEEIKQMCALLN